MHRFNTNIHIYKTAKEKGSLEVIIIQMQFSNITAVQKIKPAIPLWKHTKIYKTQHLWSHWQHISIVAGSSRCFSTFILLFSDGVMFTAAVQCVFNGNIKWLKLFFNVAVFIPKQSVRFRKKFHLVATTNKDLEIRQASTMKYSVN